MTDYPSETLPQAPRSVLESLHVGSSYRQDSVRLLVYPSVHGNYEDVRIRGLASEESSFDLSVRTKAQTKKQTGTSTDEVHDDFPHIYALKQTASDTKFFFVLVSASCESHLCELFYCPGDDDVIVRNVSESNFSISELSGDVSSQRSGLVLTQHTQSLTVGVWRLNISGKDFIDLRLLPRLAASVRKPSSSHSGKKARLQEGLQHQSDANKAPDLHHGDHDDTLVLVGHISELSEGQTIEIPGTSDMAAYEVTKIKQIDSHRRSEVFIASHSKHSERLGYIAVKTTRVDKLARGDHRGLISLLKTFSRECNIHGQLQHPSIVPFLGFDARYTSLYLEYIQGSDLGRDPWKMEDDLCSATRDEAMTIWAQISSAIRSVHANGFAHNDIKPANILVEGRGNMLKSYLCDFGIALRDEKVYTGGTRFYVPPEQLGTDGRGQPGDVWAFGVTMLYVYRRLPFPDARGDKHHPRPLRWHISESGPAGSKEANDKMRSWLDEVIGVADALPIEREPSYAILQKMLDEDQESRMTTEQLVQALQTYSSTTETGTGDGKHS